MKTKLVVLFLVLVLIVPLSLFASTKEKAPAEGGKKYEGVTITFLIQGGAAYDIANVSGKTYLQAMAEEFQELTGCEVKLVGAPWENLMPKIINDVTTGANQFDGGLYDIEFQYSIRPYCLQINDFIEETGYDMDGFLKPVYRYGEWSGEGIRYGLPLLPGIAPIVYRTDLVDGIPKTWKEYNAMLEKLQQEGDVKYPLTLPGVSAQLVKMWLCYYWSTGDVTISEDWKVRINNENGLWALKEFEYVIKNFCAPGVLGYDNPDAANEFVKGDAALYANWLAFILPALNNPDENAAVRDKWDVGPFPEGGTGNFVQHNMIIMKESKHPDAAFDYIAYCTNEENMKRALLDWGVDVARASVLNDPDVLEKFPYYQGYSVVLDNGRPIFPGIPYWLELFMGLAEGLGSYFSGEVADPQEALDNIADRWQKLIDENPLDFAYNE